MIDELFPYNLFGQSDDETKEDPTTSDELEGTDDDVDEDEDDDCDDEDEGDEPSESE